MGFQKLLVIDDDPQMRRVLRATLAARGFEVAEAASGEGGIARLRGGHFDCVLLDLNLPGLDGIETCRVIRKSSQVPIVVTSIRDSEKDKAAARAAGADDYITKPFGIEQLLERLGTLSGKTAKGGD